MKCKICKTRKAVLLDRYDPTNKKPTVCRECQIKRLRGDINSIVAVWKRREQC
jgi:hypothetical protein